MYYVYEWYVIETGEIFYVGKGKGKRYLVKNRNELFKRMISQYECKSRIVMYFENEKEAYNYEFQRITELKKIGQCSCNIMPGGAGGSGEWWTEELRQQYSQNNVMKRDEQRIRMSINNPMKNPDVAKRVAMQKTRSVVIGDQVFPSENDAMLAYNITRGTLTTWCTKGINPNGILCRFADQEQPIFTKKRYNACGSKGVIYKNKTYEAIIDLCDDIHIAPRTATEWLKRGYDPHGNPCRYINDDRTDLIFENRHVVRNKNKAKSININGVYYSSVASASSLLNIPKSTLYSYLQGKKYNPNIICTYDNQQPSRENSGKSISEGSTTNG